MEKGGSRDTIIREFAVLPRTPVDGCVETARIPKARPADDRDLYQRRTNGVLRGETQPSESARLTLPQRTTTGR